ncbi:hypothetical protein VTN49DRAFT_671 [Thermomyces lanuginosus]|uniref:uncharacterized protein n=1 Tax=Thermomyces lanuginosus TaxID=5541 RepID=UPI0037424A8C
MRECVYAEQERTRLWRADPKQQRTSPLAVPRNGQGRKAEEMSVDLAAANETLGTAQQETGQVIVSRSGVGVARRAANALGRKDNWFKITRRRLLRNSGTCSS